MIREAVADDYLEICNICTEELGYNCAPELVKYRLENLDPDRERVFVAEADGRAVGFVHVEKYKVLYCDSMVNILGLAVAGKYQKNGHGKQLMQAAEQWANENRVPYVRLNSGMARKEAHTFYRAIGYDREKEQIRFMKEL